MRVFVAAVCVVAVSVTGVVPAAAQDVGDVGEVVGETLGDGGSAVEPVIETPPGYAPGEEIVVARDRTSKTFAGAEPGMRRTVRYSHPVHYRAGDGAGWDEIDVVLRADGEARFRNVAHEFGLSVARDQRDPALARLELPGDVGVSFGLEGARPGSAAPDPKRPDTIVYRGALPGVDVALTSTEDGLKEALVLKSADAPTVFRFPLALEGLTAEVSQDGTEVTYRDASGVVRLATPAGWMAEPDDARDAAPELSDGVRYRLEGDGASPVLVVELDQAWLSDPSRIFPVTVDPTYQYFYDHEPYFYADVYYVEGSTSTTRPTPI